VSATLDRSAAVAAWRQAESRVYPTVMVNADLYQQYIGVVRAVADSLASVRTEDDLVAAWYEQREIVREVVSSNAPPMLSLMDLDAVRDAAFCHRHREVTREQGKEIARQRLEQAKTTAAEWVLLFEDVTPVGSQSLEMHVASGRALHAAATLPLDASTPQFELTVVQLDPRDGAWLVDQPPVMPTQKYTNRDEWEARINQARVQFGKA
jgi:hypothetical protein